MVGQPIGRRWGNQRERMEQAARYRFGLGELLATISTHFINLPTNEIDEGISQALQAVGEFVRVDRSYVFVVSDDGTKMDNTHEWCAEGIEPQIDSLKALPVEMCPWWIERLNRFETIHVRRVADLPPEASAERELLQAQEVQSLIVVPIVCRGSLLGFLGLGSMRAERAWSEDAVSLLRVAGDVIASVLERRRAEAALRESESRFGSLFESSSPCLFEAYLTRAPGTILRANRHAMGIYGLSPEVIGSLTVCELESRATVAALCVRVGLWHDTLDHSPAQMHIQLYELEEILRRIIHEVRGAIFALRAAALEQLGFFAAVRRFISDSAEQNQLHIEVRVLGRENQPSTALQPVLFQIIQEALHNVAKHAQAHDIVGDERPFPPAAARHYAVPIAIGKLNHLEGFADGADLVSLEQHDIGCAYLDSMPQPLRTRRE